MQPFYPALEDFPPNFGAPYVASPPEPEAAPPVEGWSEGTYAPLRTRTVRVALGMSLVPLFTLSALVAQLVFRQELKADDPSPTAVLVTFAVTLGWLSATVFTAVYFGLWIYRASRNLRALGRTGLTFSPGWCVGWFYVPIASLFQSPRVMAELWCASEPDGAGDRWRRVTGTPLVGAWWAAYIGSGVMSYVARYYVDDPVKWGTTSFLSAIGVAAAAILCVMLMFGIDKRQEAAAAQMRQNPAAPPPYLPGGAPPYTPGGAPPFQG